MASGRTLAEVLSMAIPEYAGWMRFLAEHPQGDERTQILLATLCSMFANANRKKGSQKTKPTDFAPWLNRASEKPEVRRQAEENRKQARKMRERLREARAAT